MIWERSGEFFGWNQLIIWSVFQRCLNFWIFLVSKNLRKGSWCRPLGDWESSSRKTSINLDLVTQARAPPTVHSRIGEAEQIHQVDFTRIRLISIKPLDKYWKQVTFNCLNIYKHPSTCFFFYKPLEWMASHWQAQVDSSRNVVQKEMLPAGFIWNKSQRIHQQNYG